MNRLSFETIFMNLAFGLSGRSTCKRLNVGAVITSEDFRKIYGIGYNGNATGLSNHCDSDEPGKCGCIHAEENAIINCNAKIYESKIVFCTHLPCVMCAKRLINLGGVKKVYYCNDYRIKDSLDIFNSVGIEFERIR